MQLNTMLVLCPSCRMVSSRLLLLYYSNYGTKITRCGNLMPNSTACVTSQKASCSVALQGVWPAVTSFQWSESAKPLVHAIAKKQQQNAIQLVSCAYSSIQPAQLAALTGSTSQEVLQSKLASLAMHRATLWSIWHT